VSVPSVWMISNGFMFRRNVWSSVRCSYYTAQFYAASYRVLSRSTWLVGLTGPKSEACIFPRLPDNAVRYRVY